MKMRMSVILFMGILVSPYVNAAEMKRGFGEGSTLCTRSSTYAKEQSRSEEGSVSEQLPSAGKVAAGSLSSGQPKRR
jgi:hypothetical protein